MVGSYGGGAGGAGGGDNPAGHQHHNWWKHGTCDAGAGDDDDDEEEDDINQNCVFFGKVVYKIYFLDAPCSCVGGFTRPTLLSSVQNLELFAQRGLREYQV